MATGRQSALAGIALGANLGDRAGTLLAAWREIGARPGIQVVALSSPWLSAPLGMHSEREFVNAVGLVKSLMPPLELLALLLEIEAHHGRQRNPQEQGYQDRPLDLDLLFYGDLTLESKTLTLPHSRLHERLFVLAPLAELLPQWHHPHLNASALELAHHLHNQSAQKLQQSDWPSLTTHS